MEPDSPPTPAAAGSSRVRWPRILVTLASLALLVFLISLWIKPAASPNFVWVEGSAIPSMNKQTTWSRLRLQLIRSTYPVWRYFRRSRPTVLVESRLLGGTDLAFGQLGGNLGGPISTNGHANTRAWILSAAEWESLRAALRDISGLSTLGQSRLSTASGTDAVIAVGNSGTNSFRVYLNPKLAGKSIRLGIGSEWLQGIKSPANQISCRVLLPNGGALVVEAAGKSESGSQFLIFTAMAVDARGNPLKL